MGLSCLASVCTSLFSLHRGIVVERGRKRRLRQKVFTTQSNLSTDFLRCCPSEATTVGYGDQVPTTTAGKIIGIAVFYIGIAPWPLQQVSPPGPLARLLATGGLVSSPSTVQDASKLGFLCHACHFLPPC